VQNLGYVPVKKVNPMDSAYKNNIITMDSYVL